MTSRRAGQSGWSAAALRVVIAVDLVAYTVFIRSQNLGTAVTALLPALFASMAPPGSSNIWLTVGSIAFGVTVISSLAAMTARETYRIQMNDLGKPGAVPVPKAEYDRLREESIAQGSVAHA